ncbi:MAG: hypothetical protein GXO79_05320 [Chlorobi bacterium]|nr:hypothetical protein [Chlorobiota bacterium]
MKNLWKYISDLGKETSKNNDTNKEIELSNQINIVLIFISLIIIIVSIIENAIHHDSLSFNTYKIVIVIFVSILSLLLAYYKLLRLSKIVTSTIPSFMFILAPAILGYVQEEDFIYAPYIAIALSLLPHLLFSAKKERIIHRTIIVYYIVLISLYDFALFQLPQNIYPIIPVIKPFIIYYFTAHALIFLFINLAVIYLKKINYRYERKFRIQNKKLTQYQKELFDKNAELIKIINKLQTTQSQLIQKDKLASLGILTAGLAHELNNPLNFISGGIQNIENRHRDLEELIRNKDFKPDNKTMNDLNKVISDFSPLIDIIKEGVFRSEKIIKGLKSFTQLDKDNFKLSDIHEGLDSTLTLLQGNFTDKIKIIKNYHPEVQPVFCYLADLNQVFMNVLKNSVEAIHDKGTISISTSVINNKEAVKYNLNGKFIKIVIKDSGKGISENILDRIFLPFFTTKNIGEGTGLGLSISYKIIEKHKGKIIVNSEIGKGTEVILFISSELSELSKD